MVVEEEEEEVRCDGMWCIAAADIVVAGIDDDYDKYTDSAGIGEHFVDREWVGRTHNFVEDELDTFDFGNMQHCSMAAENVLLGVPDFVEDVRSKFLPANALCRRYSCLCHLCHDGHHHHLFLR